MRVKIVSDGTRAGTRIEDADTGEALNDLRVYGIKWEIPTDMDAAPVCLLTCRSTNVELVAEADVEMMPPRASRGGGGGQNR